MFNFLKTTSPEETKIIVDRIHKEFYNASNELVIEAASILEAINACEVEKAERLKNLGFRQSKEVVATTEQAKLHELAKKNCHTIDKYKVAYPNYKFITQEQVTAICNKYNLVIGKVENYKGFVPEKNLTEFEVFKDAHEKAIIDKHFEYCKYTLTDWKLSDVSSNKLFWTKVLREMRKRKHIFQSNNRHSVQEEVVEFARLEFSDQYNKVSKSFWIDSVTMSESYTSRDWVICAPEKDMDTRGMKKFGVSFLTVTKHEYPDPVVLKPIKGGFLIVTAWGDEASDPLVVNERNN